MPMQIEELFTSVCVYHCAQLLYSAQNNSDYFPWYFMHISFLFLYILLPKAPTSVNQHTLNFPHDVALAPTEAFCLFSFFDCYAHNNGCVITIFSAYNNRRISVWWQINVGRFSIIYQKTVASILHTLHIWLRLSRLIFWHNNAVT